MHALLQNPSLPCSSKVHESLWCPNYSSSSTCNGSKAAINLKSVKGKGNMCGSSFPSLDKDENGDEEYDECFRRPGKKRRLSADQVHFLERNFGIEDKLDPERKVQLAKEVGLQPRQVAIWFQNRRARFKTKELEKDYDCLRASYHKLKDDYENILKDNEILKNEVHSLKEKLLIKDSGKENQVHICRNADISVNSESQKLDAKGAPDTVANIPDVSWKQEDGSSVKSDVYDSDSPHYLDGSKHSVLEPAYSSNIFEQDNNITYLEPAYSSNVFESDQSDFSQDDGNDFSKCLLQTSYFPKLEDDVCDFGFSIEDQLFCFWP